MSAAPIVTARGIRKAFGPVEVLHGVDFDVLPGEVHVLAGENGAGKSTLIKILSGVHDDFSGELRVGGRLRRFHRPDAASQAGIATIHQELSLVPSMSVADNLFLGREATRRFGWIDFRFQAAEAARVLAGAQVDCSPHQPAGELPIATQQLIEITRALARDASVVILDEPTSALGERDVDRLFARLLALKRRGVAIVYITHRMEEIYRLADRITVLRDGSRVGTSTPEALPPADLVAWMVGREPTASSAARPAPSEEPALEVEHLRVSHASVPSRLVVDDMSFVVRRGETVGLAGLQGAGASEILHAIFGALGRRVRGRVRVAGMPFQPRDPRESIRCGVVLLTNDRKSLGLAPNLSVLHNISLASLPRFSTRGGWVSRPAERQAVERVTREFALAAPSLDAPARVLSGGNQQKAYLARCLLAGPRVLLLDEPTRGIDVGAKADIYERLRAWTGRGLAVLLLTSELDELIALSDRVLVLHRGRLTAEFTRDTVSKDAVIAAAMGDTDGLGIGGAA
jgi:ABC-type sugar transport system ATPase subunit